MKKRCLIIGITSLYLFSNPLLTNILMLWWETPATPLNKLTQQYDLGIVLAGVMNVHKSPNDRFYTNKGADRVLHTAMLYQKGVIKKILVTGNYTKLDGDVRDEAANIKELFLLCGVPDSVIIMENKAKNTRESAIYCSEIIQKDFSTSKLLLITSAFHIKRSVACFEKVGLEVTPFSTDFYSIDLDINPMTILIPNESSFLAFNKLVHEITGYLIYKLIGYA